MLAVANRPGIGTTVSDAIVGSPNRPRSEPLLCNQTAQIREATLDAAGGAVRAACGVAGAAGAPAALSPRAQRMLSEIVTGHLLEALAARGRPGPEGRQTLRAALARNGHATGDDCSQPTGEERRRSRWTRRPRSHRRRHC